MTPIILFVDDDGEALLSLTRALKASGLDASFHGAGTAERARALFKDLTPHVVVLDLSLTPREGVESGYVLLSEFTELSPSTRVIILTGHGGKEYGIRALEKGAAHFLEKPPDILHLRALIRDSVSQSLLLREMYALKHSSHGVSSLIGESDLIKKTHREIVYAASTNQTVLLLGETGTGKGVCAKEIHRLSARNSGKLVRYQPTFATSDLVNSDLFGHAKGAFTGALEHRRGLLLEAHSGTFFLDEIDQLPLETQVALLGVLQDREVRPVGSNRSEPSDFRLVAACNSNLQESVEKETFRRDLFHRIAHCIITLPPLRLRGRDIILLSEHFLLSVREREHLNVFSLSGDVIEKLLSYNWPGNVRELEAVIEGAAFHASFRGGSKIESVDLSVTPLAQQSIERGISESFAARVEGYKINLIEQALVVCEGNQVKAAESLKIERSTLRRILGRRGGG